MSLNFFFFAPMGYGYRNLHLGAHQRSLPFLSGLSLVGPLPPTSGGDFFLLGLISESSVPGLRSSLADMRPLWTVSSPKRGQERPDSDNPSVRSSFRRLVSPPVLSVPGHIFAHNSKHMLCTVFLFSNSCLRPACPAVKKVPFVTNAVASQ